jgi:hypothetical protein
MEYPYDKVTYYRLSDEDKKGILRRLVKVLEKDDRIRLAFIFGSFTRRSSVRDVERWSSN